MSSRSRKSGRAAAPVALLALAALVAWGPRPRQSTPALHVCADPNNLPFSNRRREGFENRVAEMLARELHRTLEYTWAPEWRGFIRKGLGAGRCDVIMGIPAESDRVLTTRPYYTSTYVFLSRRDRRLDIRSLDDPRLRSLRIGLHFIGDDYRNPPPADALARRGIVRNIVGYSIYGDYSRPNPPADLVRAVARREVDLAIVWGPFAGYFGNREGVPMRITPVTPAVDPPGIRYTFAIAAGVRRDDTTLHAELDSALARRRSEIDRILRQYGVPLVRADSTDSLRSAWSSGDRGAPAGQLAQACAARATASAPREVTCAP